MTPRKISMVPATAGLVAALVSGAAATGMGQTGPPAAGTAPRHQPGMKGLQGLPGGSHHVLAMAYRDTLATLAAALRGQVRHAATVNLDLARPAVAEMRRRFDQIQEHHQAQMTMMGSQAKPPRVEHLETHLAELGEHLTALESDVSGSTPDPKKVSRHATAILKQCAEMSVMPPKPRERRTKP